LLWGVPQTMLQSMVGVMRNLGIPTHIESFYSPNLFSNTEYELLGVPVLSIYPHCGEMSSFMEVSRELAMLIFITTTIFGLNKSQFRILP